MARVAPEQTVIYKNIFLINSHTTHRAQSISKGGSSYEFEKSLSSSCALIPKSKAQSQKQTHGYTASISRNLLREGWVFALVKEHSIDRKYRCSTIAVILVGASEGLFKSDAV